MIIALLGPPGIGKTTISDHFMQIYGIPVLELSWVPEFRILNGQRISYEQDEAIAIKVLYAAANVYTQAGHHVVMLTDFRVEVVNSVFELQDEVEGVSVILWTSDEDVLRSRILSRTEGFRDPVKAIADNSRWKDMLAPHAVRIDVNELSIEQICSRILALADPEADRRR